MKARKIAFAVCSLTLIFDVFAPLATMAQSTESRPRRVQSGYNYTSQPALAEPRYAAPRQSGFESSLPRAGLLFYIEIRGAGLQEMARAGALGPLAKVFLGEHAKASASSLATFLTSNLSALSGARIAMAAYRAGNVGVIETVDEVQAQQLKAAFDPVRAKDIAIVSKGRTLIAGVPEAALGVAQFDGQASMANDTEFLSAYQRFADEPFFGFFDIGSQIPLAVANGADAAVAGSLIGAGSLPSSIVFAGAVEGESFVLRAMTIGGNLRRADSLPGVFSSLFSATTAGQPVAAGLAPADSDVFVDLMIDWNVLYQVIGSLAAMFAGTMSRPDSASPEVADPLARIEGQLGFSIKNDLIPTLGNEVAISLSGLDKLASPPAKTRSASTPQSAAAPRPPSSIRFTAMIALSDPAGFEKLFAKLLTGSMGASAQFVRTPYRNATIVRSKSFAYAIADGFVVLSGSPSDVRRVLDARWAGTSLASSSEFRSVVPDSGQAILRAYVSSSIITQMVEGLSKEAGLKSASAGVQPSAVGLELRREGQDTLMECRMPTRLAYALIAAVANSKPGQGSVTGLPGVGIPEPTGPRTGNGRRSPTLTNDDIRRP